MYKLYCRVYQRTFRLVSYVLPWRKPELLEGENSLNRLPALMKSLKIDTVLIVTDSVISSLGLMEGLLEGLEREDIKYHVYDKTVPNPTIDNIEEAFMVYKGNNCEGIIAFGGGSSMDCAKGVGARVARPNKSVTQLKGVLKVRKKLPVLFAIPTTSGTGSETTIAAVITDSRTHEKYAINDMSLIPHYAVLDPTLTIKLPQHITSTTGMDALTHAVEAYIGNSNTHETKEQAKQATKLIFENLFEAYTNSTNLTARANMQKAAYLAGLAFTRAYVGYVHAVAHTLGGFYSMPHGLANAVILPYVLDYYGDSVHKQLAELADFVGLTTAGEAEVKTETEKQKAQRFILAIRQMNKKMNIPEKISGINEQDIPMMVERASKEANPLYPVPKILFREDLNKIYHIIKE